MRLFASAVSKYLLGLIIIGALLYIPAGSFGFVNGWLFIILLFVPMLVLGAVLLIKSPKLLEKRLDAREKENTQKGVVAASGVIFAAGFIMSGLDWRFGISKVPVWVVAAASLVLVVSYGVYAEVMRENAYLSRTVEVQEGQRVVDTGLYGVVRHPMYGATVLMFLAIPLVLGSWWALLLFVPYIPMIIVRIINEEKVLLSELEGYAEYKKRVKYRLIPFIF